MLKDPKKLLKSKSVVDYICNHTNYNLVKTGKNYSCPCPFHSEHESSFYVNPEKNRWTCYGKCGLNGDLLDFVQRDKNLSFTDTLKYLCKLYGIEYRTNQESSIKDKIKDICNFASEFYRSFLTDNYAGKKYLLTERKQRLSVINKFQIGYAPDPSENGWQTLSSELYKKGFDLSLCEKIGLITKGERNYIDRFRGRIIFPINNLSGDCIGFNSRLIEKNVNAPRYLLSHNTDVFNRKKIFYGLDVTSRLINEKKSVVLVEGIFDFLRLYSYGIHNSLPLLGGNFNSELLDKADVFYLMMDADLAGRKYSKKIGKYLISKDKICYVCNLEKDPDEVSKKEIIQGFKSKSNFIDWYIDEIYQHKEIIEHKLQILYKVSKILENVGEINMMLYIDKVSNKLNIPVEITSSIFTKNKPNYKDIYLAFKEN